MLCLKKRWLVKKLRDTGKANRLTGSGKPRSARTEENVDMFNDLVLSQEGTLQTRWNRDNRLRCYEVTTMSLEKCNKFEPLSFSR